MYDKVSKILVVQPVAALAQLYCGHLEEAGYRVDISTNSGEALALLTRNEYSLVISDSQISQYGLLEILSAPSDETKKINLLLLAGQQEQNLISLMMKKGAADYLIKPVCELRLLTTVKNIIANLSMHAVISRFNAESDLTGFHGLIGSSVAMQTVYKTVRHVANSDSPVFIKGELGTGKVKCATAVHAASQRASKPFIAIDCKKLTTVENLDTVLFGDTEVDSHSIDGEKSVLRKANGGTVFLNNIDSMPIRTQKKLLKFIRTGKLKGYGLSSSEENMDIRFITGAKSSIKALTWRGAFIEELFVHLNMLPITLPALRDRDGDVVALANHFLREIAEEQGATPISLTPTMINKLKEHNWPGNVQELQYWLQSLINQRHASGKQSMPPFRAFDVDNIDDSSNVVSIHLQQAVTSEEFSAHTCKLEEFERWIIESRIRAKGGSIPKAAESLGISPSTIYRKRESWVKDVSTVVNS